MNYLPLLIVLPLAGALLSLGTRGSRRLASILIAAVFAALLASAGLVMIEAWDGNLIVHRIGSWPAGLGLGLAADRLGSVMVMIVTGIGALCVAFSFGEIGERNDKNRFLCAILFLIAGLNGILLATDLFNLFVFVEVASVSGYVLVAYLGGEEELEASLKYMILGTLTSFLFLVGIAMIYDQVGSLNLGAIGDHLMSEGINNALEFSVLLIIMGIGMPAAIFPFHTWLPDAHSKAPSAISAMLSGASVQVAVYAMLRVFTQSFGLESVNVLRLLPWMGLATALLGGALALVQTDIKRLLAYTTVSSGGLSIVLLSMGSVIGFKSLFFHLVNHATAKALLFLSAGCLIHSLSKREYTEMRGAWNVLPGVCLAFIIGAVADLGGPSLGFLGKTYLLLGLAEYSTIGTMVAGLAIIMVAVSYLRVFHLLLSSEGDLGERRNVPAAMGVPMALLALACVALGLLAWTILGHADAVANQIMDRLGMIASMLGI